MARTTTTKAAPAKKSAKAPAKAPARSAAAKKPAAKPVKLAAGSTVSLKQLAAGLAESHEMPKRQVEAMLGELVDTFTGHLKKGIKIRMNGLGIFQVRARPARLGRNPATGEQIQIKASKKIAFRPAKELKEAI
jgi:DNA-binding protein HU-beta